MAFGGVLHSGNSALFDGPVGVVKIGFKGHDLGKTGADTVLSLDQDVKDIIYQQDGTKAADSVRTGIELSLSVTLSEISRGLLTALVPGITSQSRLPTTDSGTIGRNIFQSLKATESGILKISAVNDYGIASEKDEDTMTFYEAFPVIDSELINWGADTQRNLPLSFRIKYYVFPQPHNYGHDGAFGFWGDPTVENVSPILWPTVGDLEMLLASTTDPAHLTATFDKNLKLTKNWDNRWAMANINGIMTLSTTGVVSGKTLKIGFPLNSFVRGSNILLSISSEALEDADNNKNKFPGISGFMVNNTI